MDIILIILASLAGLFVLYVLMLAGRRGNPGLQAFPGYSYTHRGLYGNGVPENSLEAFSLSVQHGYGAELDVHLLKDGELAIIHDHALERTTGRQGLVEELTAADLSGCFLEGTAQTIPTFRQMLSVFDGKVPLILELKAWGSNHGALVDTVMEQLRDYPGAYCLESFDPRCILYLKKHYPHVVRGQLYENYCKSGSRLPWLLKFCLTHQLFNFLVCPDFVAYKFPDRKTPGNFLVRRLWRLQGVTWTVKTPQEYETARSEGWIPIFEGFEPDTALQ